MPVVADPPLLTAGGSIQPDQGDPAERQCSGEDHTAPGPDRADEVVVSGEKGVPRDLGQRSRGVAQHLKGEGPAGVQSDGEPERSAAPHDDRWAAP